MASRLISLLCLCTFSLHAQPNRQIHLKLSGLSDPFLLEKTEQIFKGASDSSELPILTKKWMETVRPKGWQASTLESFSLKEDTFSLHFFQGPLYILDSLIIEESILRSHPDLQLYLRKKPPLDWETLEKKLLTAIRADQGGYALASLELEGVTYQEKSSGVLGASVHYRWESGPRILVDSLQVAGEVRERLSFIYAFLGVEQGMPFTNQLLATIKNRLDNSIYFELDSIPYVEISPANQATIHLPIKNKNNSRFDILLGILQQPQENDLSLQLTGSADITLISPFRRGERFTFLYQKLTTTSQALFTQLAIPYILGTPFQVEGSFDIRNQEDQFLVRTFQAAVSYQFSPEVSARLTVNNRASRLLDSTISTSSLSIPSLLDGVQQSVGTGIRINTLDYQWNPRKGIFTDVVLSIGSRDIRRNALVDEAVYERLAESQSLLELQSQFSVFSPLGGRHVMHLANHTYWLNQEVYFLNDLLQVGGARSLRGFNENEFFTNLYSRFSAEYRLLLEKNSFMYTFFDYAYLENRASGEVLHPMGIGLGMNYETKAGIISISYAVGKSENQDFQPTRGKIHIGFVNQF